MTLVHDEAPAVRLQAARALVSSLLVGHPEARSLLSEASHWRGLAAHSAAVAATASRAADLARTRRHWRRAVRHRDTAAATARADAGTAAVTRESWLGLVRTTAAEEDEHLAREATAVAAGMI